MKDIESLRIISCYIIDDELDVRKRLRTLLSKISDITVIGDDEASEDAIEEVLELKPDIVFIDVEMPRINGFEFVKRIRSSHLNPTFIFVTAFNQYAIKAIKNEAFDFILKPVDIDELAGTIERYRESKSIKIKSLRNLPEFESLTGREKEILELILNGLTSQEVSDKLFISLNTVNTHRRNILKKTNSESIFNLLTAGLK